MINTIGPVWDGNEVWLLVAGGATFAAFPEWYATLFSGFYLPLLLILVALIVRGVAFEYRGKVDSDRLAAQLGPRHLLGLGACPRCCGAWRSPTSWPGVPLDADHEYTGTLLHAAQPLRACSAAWSPSALFTLHGALLPGAEDRRPGPRSGPTRWPRRIAPVVVVVAAAFLLWTPVPRRPAAVLGPDPAGRGARWSARSSRAGAAARAGRSRCTGTTLALTVASLFATLYPDVMPSSTDPAYSLTVDNAVEHRLHAQGDDRGSRSLLTPVVLGYQAWTYWVFRQRISRRPHPAGAVAGRLPPPRRRRRPRRRPEPVRPVDPRLLRVSPAARRYLARHRRARRRGHRAGVAQAWLLADAARPGRRRRRGRRRCGPRWRCCSRWSWRRAGAGLGCRRRPRTAARPG